MDEKIASKKTHIHRPSNNNPKRVINIIFYLLTIKIEMFYDLSLDKRTFTFFQSLELQLFFFPTIFLPRRFS